MTHIPVLLKESVDLLDLKPADVYLDATLGAGGHAEEVYKRLGNTVEIWGIDADSSAVEMAKVRLELAGKKDGKLAVLNFRKIAETPEIFGGNSNKFPSKILFDLGWNKSQFDEGGRGFSFQKDEPLLMTFSKETREDEISAYDIVNSWDEENIETIISAYGEEKFSWRIAKAIVEARRKERIETSGKLAEIVKQAVPVFYRFGRIHPATKTFQALRIAVNDEIRSLEEGLKGAFEILQNGGRVAVISFHSLEDRVVKRFFKSLSDEEKAKILTKKPITASEIEIDLNPRSRSAKLRVVQKV